MTVHPFPKVYEPHGTETDPIECNLPFPADDGSLGALRGVAHAIRAMLDLIGACTVLYWLLGLVR